LGRAIKTTQVELTAPVAFSEDTNLQPVLEAVDAAIARGVDETENLGNRIGAIEAGWPITITKSDQTVPGGAVQKSGNNYVIYFNTGGGGGSGSNGVSGATVMDPGTVVAWPASEIPEGWLLCDGASLSTNEYSDLFGAIGWKYSPNASDRFNVPDYRGVALVGVEGDRGLFDTTNRISSGLGGVPEGVGSFQGPARATTTDGDVVRLPNTYVNWIIKARDDTKYFVSSVVVSEGTGYAFTNNMGTLLVTHPPATLGSPRWHQARIVSASGGDTGIKTPFTMNQTITAYYSDGDIHSGRTPILAGYVGPTPDSLLMIARVQCQGADPYADGGAFYCITFDVPAGMCYRVMVHNYRVGSNFRITTVYKP
jgi:microcystin-dependent protein